MPSGGTTRGWAPRLLARYRTHRDLTVVNGRWPNFAPVALDAGFQLYPIAPSEAQWNDGVTDTFCVVGSAEAGTTFEGTLKGAGTP